MISLNEIRKEKGFGGQTEKNASERLKLEGVYAAITGPINCLL